MTPSGPPWGVVHCVHSLDIGGQEMVILSLVANVCRERFAPRVLCLHHRGTLAPRFDALGIPVDVLESPLGQGSFGALRAMTSYLGKHRPAILHTHNPSPHQFGALARLASGVPLLVHTKHGRNQTLTPKGRLFERVASRLTDAIVPVSEDAAEVARTMDGVPAKRVHVIRNGISMHEPVVARAPNRRWRVVHVARLNKVKDQATLLRAARLVADREPLFRLDIVGDGEEREVLERLAQELNLGAVVRFHGSQNNVWPFLAEAELFVLSSLSEGIALTLLEAMAAALPVVATDVGGNREVVIPEKTGVLVPPGDPHAMANAILDTLRDPVHAGALGTAGQARVRQDFSLATTVQSYEALYLRLLRSKLGPSVQL